MESVAPTAINLSAFLQAECRAVCHRSGAPFAAQHQKGGAQGSKQGGKKGGKGGKTGGKGGKMGRKSGKKGHRSRNSKGTTQSWGSSGWGSGCGEWQQA